MKFYAYLSELPLGKEPLGTAGKLLFELKTKKGAIKHCQRIWKEKKFHIYTYTNFYDNDTFRVVFVNGVVQ
jgi:hypothetical protein